MSTSVGWRHGSRSSAADSESLGHPAPGKQTWTQTLPAFDSHQGEAPVQRTGTGAGGAGLVHAAAQAGVSGGGGALPFAEQIQASFGTHDVSGVRAHVGGAASDACDAMGAQAYATGTQVAFAGAPDLHTAAHEAAHVVQQRAGVHLLGGVGRAGDTYEQHADEVADLVVQGKSAQAALDRHAGGGGGGGGALQHKLVVGKQEIDPKDVDTELAQAFMNKLVGVDELLAVERLRQEASDAKETYTYQSWKDAAVGVREHDLSKAPSVSIQRGSITFTNVVKKFHPRAEQLLDMLVGHPSISAYINNRPCFISLVRSPDNPASVIDLGKQVNIELAYWYFETYPLGYQLGMLCHEFAVHPMADSDQGVKMIEPMSKGIELDSGVKDGKKAHMVNTDRAGQVDHIFASIIGMPRNKVYTQAVLEMASLLVQEAGKKGSGIDLQEVTNLLDCFMMDCASILATNDHRDKGALVPGLIATVYNDYLQMLQSSVTDKTVLKCLPKPKSSWGVAKDYFGLLGSVVGGSLKNASRDREHYQPTDQQTQYLEQNGRRLHWIEPDGRCVFGALAHIAGISTHAAISQTLEMLNRGSAGLTQIITDAGQNVAAVLECIRKGRWDDEEVGDIILEVAATALGQSVTVLMPNGSTHDINGGGRIIVRVTSPLEHYHSVDH